MYKQHNNELMRGEKVSGKKARLSLMNLIQR